MSATLTHSADSRLIRAADHLAHALRDRREPRASATLPVSEAAASAASKPHDLARRTADCLGLAWMRFGDARSVRRVPRRESDVALDLGDGEAAELDDPGCLLARQLRECRAERITHGWIDVAVRAERAKSRLPRGRLPRTATAGATARRRRAGRRSRTASGCLSAARAQKAGGRVEEAEARAFRPRVRARGRSGKSSRSSGSDLGNRARAGAELIAQERRGQRRRRTSAAACTQGQNAGAPPASQQRPRARAHRAAAIGARPPRRAGSSRSRVRPRAGTSGRGRPALH